MDQNDELALDAFIGKYKDNDNSEINTFIRGLESDLEAVKNCLRHPKISNGPIEGMNNRSKFTHRRSGGRASVELLSAYRILSNIDAAG